MPRGLKHINVSGKCDLFTFIFTAIVKCINPLLNQFLLLKHQSAIFFKELKREESRILLNVEKRKRASPKFRKTKQKINYLNASFITFENYIFYQCNFLFSLFPLTDFLFFKRNKYSFHDIN